ncbi:MAG: rhodanese-like domain-containing protein [Anaerolineae bacterium]|jgi:rhodanese-related sulfurtransferase|nr:rhodanese-like domain-containing protein [Anaerolineae bacterium]
MNIFNKLFSGGVASISPEEAEAKLNGGQPPFLLDVRSQAEFREAHIKGAKLIPLDELPRRMGELPKDRDILVVCRSGARSGIAAGQLNAAGFTVTNLSGGLMAWSQRRLPLVSGK